MAIPIIQRGDTSREITLALTEGYEYGGCTLEVEFYGVERSFTGLEAGATIELSYTADETADMPLGTGRVLLSIRNAAGMVRQLPWAKIKVTDAPSEVYAAQITIDPATLDVEDATAGDSLGAVKKKLNAVLAFLRGVAVLAVCALPCFGAEVAPLYTTPNDIPGDAPLMTNAAEYVDAVVDAKADKASVYTTSEVDAKVAAVGSKADEAYSAAEQMVNAVNSLSGTVGSHIRDTDNPHKVTAAQVGAYTRAEVDSKIESAVLPTDPTFSNAVLSVGLNIDTDSVAVLNEIASTFGGFPIEGTATTVGGLLAALAAAVAWLRKNKADKATSSASAALLSDNAVALVDGSAGGETAVSFKAPFGNALRYCELMLTGVASDGAVTLVLPTGTYQFADGADSVPKGNSHFCFAEYARGKWLVTRQSTTEKAVEEVGA